MEDRFLRRFTVVCVASAAGVLLATALLLTFLVRAGAFVWLRGPWDPCAWQPAAALLGGLLLLGLIGGVAVELLGMPLVLWLSRQRRGAAQLLREVGRDPRPDAPRAAGAVRVRVDTGAGATRETVLAAIDGLRRVYADPQLPDVDVPGCSGYLEPDGRVAADLRTGDGAP